MSPRKMDKKYNKKLIQLSQMLMKNDDITIVDMCTQVS